MHLAALVTTLFHLLLSADVIGTTAVDIDPGLERETYVKLGWLSPDQVNTHPRAVQCCSLEKHPKANQHEGLRASVSDCGVQAHVGKPHFLALF